MCLLPPGMVPLRSHINPPYMEHVVWRGKSSLVSTCLRDSMCVIVSCIYHMFPTKSFSLLLQDPFIPTVHWKVSWHVHRSQVKRFRRDGRMRPNSFKSPSLAGGVRLFGGLSLGLFTCLPFVAFPVCPTDVFRYLFPFFRFPVCLVVPGSPDVSPNLCA